MRIHFKGGLRVMSRALIGVGLVGAVVSATVLSAIVLSPTPAFAAGSCCATVTDPFPSSDTNEVIQIFEYEGKMATAWKVRFAHAQAKGMYITGAWFKRGPGQPWMQVLSELRLAEIFVAYHPGSPRYYDMSGFGFNVIALNPADVGCCGEILDGVVAKEVRPRGVVWKDDSKVYRGYELVLWSNMDAANYNYMMEYAFRDDGSIQFGVGATARNLPGQEWTAHMHLGLWRIDMDINGSANDRVHLVRHLESTTAPSAVDEITLFGGGTEGSEPWVPEEFTHLRIEATDFTNGRGSAVGYDLMPLRWGVARHQEDFSHADFWVTQYHNNETRYPNVPNYISNNESIDDQDIVVWTSTPVHHLPRDEDGIISGGRLRGSALLMWGHTLLKPRNLFDSTPFFK